MGHRLVPTTESQKVCWWWKLPEEHHQSQTGLDLFSFVNKTLPLKSKKLIYNTYYEITIHDLHISFGGTGCKILNLIFAPYFICGCNEVLEHSASHLNFHEGSSIRLLRKYFLFSSPGKQNEVGWVHPGELQHQGQHVLHLWHPCQADPRVQETAAQLLPHHHALQPPQAWPKPGLCSQDYHGRRKGKVVSRYI